MLRETPDSQLTVVRSKIHELFLRYYPHFQWNKNFAWISDVAKKELVDRLSLIESGINSNGIGLHREAWEYSFLEQACHLDSMELVHQIDFSHPHRRVLSSERIAICEPLDLNKDSMWEKIARHIENFDRTDTEVDDLLWHTVISTTRALESAA